MNQPAITNWAALGVLILCNVTFAQDQSSTQIKLTDRIPYGQAPVDYFSKEVDDAVAALNVGIRNKMRLEVFRSGKSGSKIGQIEIVSVDSASSVGRVRKLERSVRKRGGTIDVGDQVISRQRPPKDASNKD